jgi:hypothetical protein
MKHSFFQSAAFNRRSKQRYRMHFSYWKTIKNYNWKYTWCKIVVFFCQWATPTLFWISVIHGGLFILGARSSFLRTATVSLHEHIYLFFFFNLRGPFSNDLAKPVNWSSLKYNCPKTNAPWRWLGWTNSKFYWKMNWWAINLNWFFANFKSILMKDNKQKNFK